MADGRRQLEGSHRVFSEVVSKQNNNEFLRSSFFTAITVPLERAIRVLSPLIDKGHSISAAHWWYTLDEGGLFSVASCTTLSASSYRP